MARACVSVARCWLPLAPPLLVAQLLCWAQPLSPVSRGPAPVVAHRLQKVCVALAAQPCCWASPRRPVSVGRASCTRSCRPPPAAAGRGFGKAPAAVCSPGVVGECRWHCPDHAANFGVQKWAGGSSHYPPHIGRVSVSVCPGGPACGRSAPQAVSLHCHWQCPNHGH